MMDIKEFKDFYMKLGDIKETLVPKRKTDEEIVNELGLGEYKELYDIEDFNINRKFLKENDLDHGFYFPGISLIGDKGFVANYFHSNLKLNPLQEQFLNKLAYKDECFSIVKDGKNMFFADLDSHLILIKAMKELQNKKYIDNMDVTKEDIIYKQYENQYIVRYIFFNDGNIKFPKKISKEELKLKELVKPLPRYNESYCDATNLGKARIINPNLIRLNKLREVYLENRLPNTNLEFIVYPTCFRIKTDIRKPKNIVYTMEASLIFLEGQDKLFK